LDKSICACNTFVIQVEPEPKNRDVQEVNKRNGESVPTPTARKTPDRRERGLLTASQALLTTTKHLLAAFKC
jgi:hypothetical protein